MALVNFTAPFGALPVQSWTTISPLQRHATAINNMLYGPAGHQQENEDESDYDYDYKNDPYAPPVTLRQPQQPLRRPTTVAQPSRQPQHYRHANDYLPPPTQRNSQSRQPPKQPQQQHQHINNINSSPPEYSSIYAPTRTFGSNLEAQPRKVQLPQQQPLQPPLKQPRYNERYNENDYNVRRVTSYPQFQGTSAVNDQQSGHITITQATDAPPPTPSQLAGQQQQRGVIGGPSRGQRVQEEGISSDSTTTQNGGFPSQAPTFTRVQAGTGSNTQVHAILDYDDDDEADEYYDADDEGAQGGAHKMPTVTPIQGPIFLKNGSVPVVPLFSYPTMRNGSFVQIPIWWTALSVALGLEIRGEIIRGTPCVKKFNQLFCPTAGNSYPINRIAEFIDENKALMRRMYGDFEMSTQYGPPPSTGKRKRAASDTPPPGVPDFVGPPGSDMDEIPSPDIKGTSYFSNWRRTKRQSSSFGRASNSTARQNAANNGPTPPNEPVTGRVDACESKIEIVTPYWASNSAGKIRAIVNTQHFEQAIHQEVCTKSQTGRCGGDCGCEQKYKWHRLLAYDPDNDCRGIFMDWFLFPSCCVCRCNP